LNVAVLNGPCEERLLVQRQEYHPAKVALSDDGAVGNADLRGWKLGNEKGGVSSMKKAEKFATQ
jgi:hypothetical protein